MDDFLQESHNNNSSNNNGTPFSWGNSSSSPPSPPGTSVAGSMTVHPMVIEQPAICLGEISPHSVIPVPLLPPTATTLSGEPVRLRKKPGRKPNPASPALRKAQNRAAQRAFRERKELHLRDLETTIKALREQQNATTNELNITKQNLDVYRTENWYLKGLVLTLQFVCMHHNIHIPSHSPYLSEKALREMAHSSPHAIESYVNAYTLNNVNLKPAMASYFATSADDDSSMLDRDQQVMTPTENKTAINSKHEDDSPLPSSSCELSPPPPPTMTMSPQQRPLGTPPPQQQQQQQHDDEKEHEPSVPSLSTIQKLRLQLRVQSSCQNQHASAARLQPSLLQLTIPHDPRIDLVPTPHMRDRMIIFRDHMDYDRCFSMLLNGAVHHGGDPTLAENWELPAKFFHEYWYLTIDYDVRRTNKWRRLNGLPEIKSRQEQEQQHDKSTLENMLPSSLLTDDVLAQFIEGMPHLQPTIDPKHLHQDKLQHTVYQDIIMRSCSPDSFQHHRRSSSIGGMMDLMATLTTTDHDQHLHQQHQL